MVKQKKFPLLSIAHNKLLEQELDDDRLFEMANVTERTSGLPYVIHLQYSGNNTRHACRLKVSRGIRFKPEELSIIQVQNAFKVKINGARLSASELLRLKRWYAKNESTVLDYWNSKFGNEELLDRLKSI